MKAFGGDVALLGLIWKSCVAGLMAQTLPSFDFTTPAGVQGWVATHDLAPLTPSPTGLVTQITASDPYLTGPSRDYPAGQPLWLRLRLFSEVGGSCQVFYFTTVATEPASVRFDVPPGRVVEGRVPLPPLGPGYRMRIDPPGVSGSVTLMSLRFENRGSLPEFDFGTVPDALEWGAPHDLVIGTNTLEALPLIITGTDPYFSGPPRDYPSGTPLWMNLRIKAPVAGNAQVFFFQTGPTEANSVRFTVPGGDWSDVRVPLPALGPGTRLRLDPPGSSGTVELSRITFEERLSITEPAWPQPGLPPVAAAAPTLYAGLLALKHGPAPGWFELRVGGSLVARGNPRGMAGYLSGKSMRWFELTNAATVSMSGGVLQVQSNVTDPDGARWQIDQRFQAGSLPNTIAVESRAWVDRDRLAVFVPMTMLLPGLGSFGTNKTQGLMAGVEYLENEPSSSEADVFGPGARRKVPHSYKLTMPLMALACSNRWVGLTWELHPDLAALHDSPDRIFNSGGHLMALVYPGSDPNTREDGSVLPYGGASVKAGQILTCKATFLGGTGDTVIPAVQASVSRAGLPPIPPAPVSAEGYYDLAARGWLYSDIRDGFKFRHAVGAGFGSAAVADAPMYMDWLAARVANPGLAAELALVASNALALVPPATYNSAAVGHVRTPAAALAYRAAAANAARALAEGNARLGVFAPDGSVTYVPPSGGLDLSSTHWSKEANGLTAAHVLFVLERGAFSGNPGLIGEGLRLLRAMDKFRDTVPRGAQTWEVPLHTPDILASAYLVRAYTLGYELTGESGFLDSARYWAWTGVPFVYLRAPTTQPVGLYATIPVLGATHFVAPLWIGLPVQWCGLVYGNAIRLLAPHDPFGPWVQLADGIAISGMQQTHTPADPAWIGLLPDSFDLLSQIRNPVPINPATLLPEAIDALNAGPLYQFKVFRHHGLLLHAPGALSAVKELPDRVSFHVEAWPRAPWQILLSGFTAPPQVRSNGVPVTLTTPNTYETANGRLTLQLTGPADIEVLHPALDDLRFELLHGTWVLKLTWPAAATNYVLESAAGLSAGTAWNEITGPFYTQGDRRAHEHSMQTNQIYFRLRKK